MLRQQPRQELAECRNGHYAGNYHVHNEDSFVMGERVSASHFAKSKMSLACNCGLRRDLLKNTTSSKVVGYLASKDPSSHECGPTPCVATITAFPQASPSFAPVLRVASHNLSAASRSVARRATCHLCSSGKSSKLAFSPLNMLISHGGKQVATSYSCASAQNQYSSALLSGAIP